MDPESAKLFEQSVRAATASATGRALDSALDLLGWSDALTAEPQMAVSVVFELQGSAGASSSALADVLVSQLRSGSTPGGVMVLPRLSSLDGPGSLSSNGRLVVRGISLQMPQPQDTAFVVIAGAAAGLAIAVPVRHLSFEPIAGLDPQLGLMNVQTPPQGVPFDPEAVSDVNWEPALAMGQLALAHQLVGVASSMADMAREHALGRIQFGRPIAAFQAVRHRMAESLVAIEAARATARAGWSEQTPMSALIAKAFAGQSGRLVARHSQQILAGMGFTAEHPFHHYLRRTLVLDEMLGSSRVLTRQLGADLLRARRLPDFLPL